jgi:hypothetical protein
MVTSVFAGTVAFAGAAAAATGDVLYRANAGGAITSTDGGPDWQSDTNYLVAGDTNTASHGQPSSIDGSVPTGTPDQIWSTERWDPSSGAEMQYEFDVQSGQRVEVRLYFYDGYSGTSSPGDRVFDVSVEDQTVENFDPIEQFGDDTGGMKSVTVTSDGTVDVDFDHVTENPQVVAIELVAAEPKPDTLGGPGAVSFGQVVAGNSETKSVTVTNLGGEGDPDVTVDGASLSGNDADEFSTSFSGGVTLAPGESTDVPVTFAPSDAQPKSAQLSISHSGTNAPLTVDLSGEGVSDVPVGFGVSGLNVDLGNPTSLDFGPDGRLYVSQQNGEIKAYEITRNGANDYEVTDVEVIDAVQNIPNHDDDGTYNPNVGNRQVTGLTVEGTSSTPVVYVTSSDPRIGAGGSHTDSGLDTNSGVVSRLTQTDSGWDHDMLVRGLPRSEENHATNGIQYDAEDNVLYVAQGGHTNKGAPSDNFALTPEYALSAAILEIDLQQINSMTEKDAANTDATYLYDLPTLQGTDEPFGGQDGANMAKWTESSPVDVYAPGFRNPYDIALGPNGQLYATDNSANPGWGGIVVNEGSDGQCTNEQNEQDEYSAAGVYHIDGEDYYGGHPNPTRGNPNSQFGGAVESGLHDPVNCDYRDPEGDNPSAALETFGPTPQGMDVYPASNFGGALKGDLLLAMWNSGDVERVELNAEGTAVTSTETLFQNIGNNPLDVHAQGDEGPFPGTVWAATYGSNDITVFEPNDYEGGSDGPTCTADDPDSPDYDPDGDADNDGYTNADENQVGTDPCSQASQPPDWDQDGNPDSLDSDDDNDGLSDSEDPFAVDPQNGLDNTVPVDRQFEAGQHPQSLFGLGFTGLMTNGQNYATLYDPSKVRAGGATEKLSIDEVPFGDAYENKNSQEYAFQYGVDAPAEPFVVRTTVVAPFSDDMTPENYQSAGMQVGAGDQDNYMKLVASAQDADGNPNGGVEFVKEVDGTAESTILSEPAVFGSGQTIDLYLTVDPTTDPTPNDGTAHVAVTASYAINGGQQVEFGQTFAAPASWFTSDSQGTAVGLISTANGADSTFSASWDRLTVTAVDSNTPPTADAGSDQTVEEGATVTLDATGSSDADGDSLGYAWTQTGGPDVQLSALDDAQPTFTAPDVDGDQTLTFEVTVSDGDASDTDAVSVTVEDTDTSGETVYRVNAGGGAYTGADGTEWSADDYFDSPGSTTDAETQFGTTDVAGTEDDQLYLTERYWEDASGTEYSFPVDDGTYTVRLHLAEVYFGSQTSSGDGQRVMSANVEGGEVELDGYDIHADVGANTATVKEYTVEVTDGSLDIDFSASTNNPKISAIEVVEQTGSAELTIAEAVAMGGDDDTKIESSEIQQAINWWATDGEVPDTGGETISDTQIQQLINVWATDATVGGGGGNTAPAIDAIADQTVAEDESTTVSVSASDADGDSVSLSLGQAPDFVGLSGGQLTIEPQSGDAADSPYAVEVTATDGNGGTATESFAVTVEAASSGGQLVAAINAGGGEYTATDGTTYQADTYFDGGQTTVAGQAGIPSDLDIANTEDDALYQTERYGDPFGYDVPVPESGTYEVTLQFAEIYQGVSSNDAPDSTGPTDGTNENDRLFGASIEGQQVLSEYDLFAEVGPATATEKTYTVEVTDGTLNVDFSATNDNAKVSAITVAKVDGSPGDGPTDGEATMTVDAGEGIDATTWDSGSYVIENTGDEEIETVTLDLRSAVLPDVVFDPDGTAGDEGAKGFVPSSGADTVGLVDGSVSVPHNGVDGADGYDKLTITFDDFQPGETFTFEMDNDPTSIKGGSSVQSGEAGPISGLELSGSTVTATFADGATAETSLFSDGSAGGSQGIVDASAAPAPTIGVDGVSLSDTDLSSEHTAATVSGADQTVTVSGQPGETVTLLRVEGELNLDGVPTYDGTPGYDVQAYEANTALDVEEYTATVGSDGTATVPVTLTKSSDAGGLNYFVAATADEEGELGATSNVVVLEYDESSGGSSNAQVLHRVNAGGPEVAATDDGPAWSADTSSSPSQYLAAGGDIPDNTFTVDSVDASVPSSTPTTVFQTERYDKPASPEMHWEFAENVQSGETYEVRLYFHDGYSETSNVGDRVFGVNVEGGDQELQNFDIIETYGDQTAAMESFTVTAGSDGDIDVEFLHGAAENPQVNAIEIVETDDGSQ